MANRQLSHKVKVTCGGETETWETAQKAIDFYSEGMDWCDPGSSEYSRYAHIVRQLSLGKTEVTDKYW